MPLNSKMKKIQGLFKDLQRNLRAIQGKMEFEAFLRTSPKIQELFKTVQTLSIVFAADSIQGMIILVIMV